MGNGAMGSKAMGTDTMGSYGMKSARLHTKGFTLIASLLMLLLLSGIAIGLMMMVNTEGKVGGTDLRNDVAFHAAEGGIETMYSNLALVFQNAQSPTAAQICAVGNTPPVLAGFTFVNYSVMPGTTQSTTCPSSLSATWGQITGSGPNAGLWAQIIPVNMLATASSTYGGQEVSMVRQAQVALIPVFQFGVFSESDLSFFSGPNLDMAGPVHTNGDLYPFVGPGSTLTFHNKVEAYGNVVRTQLANGYNAATNYNGTVDVPNASNGCTTPTTNCVAMTATNSASYGDGSVDGAGGNPPQSTYNGTAWNTFSKTTTGLQFINGNYGSKTTAGTGAKDLKMPFVSGSGTTVGAVQTFQIIRRPEIGESPTSALAQSREWNLATIHVELSDSPADFLNGSGFSDPQNVRLANITTTQATATGGTATNPYGIPMTAGNYASTFTAPSGGTYNLYFAAASNAVPSAGVVLASATAAANGIDSADWPYAPLAWYGNANNSSPTAQGLQPTGPTGGPGAPVTMGSSTSVPPALVLCAPISAASPSPNYPPADGYPAGCANPPVSPYYTVNGAAVTNSSAAVAAQTATWNLIDGYLRVEYLNNSGVWVPVTNEWLALGFARGMTAPTQSGGGTPATSPDFTPTPNPINPNAILLLQEPADRGTVTSGIPNYAQLATGIAPTCLASTGSSPNIKCTQWAATPPLLVDNAATNPYWQFGLTPSSPTTQSITQFNWYPINFYDTREGEVRDNTVADNSCSSNGVMNAVEIDVGNLKRWLAGAIGTSGSSVNYTSNNGYVLYFSDRRGMLVNPNATNPDPVGVKSGDAGLEDVINAASAAGTPDGALETTPAGKTVSPEDVNENGALDNFGAANLGLGFYGTQATPGSPGVQGKNLNTQINSTAVPDPFGTAANARIASCGHTGRKNWVSGARHVLRLVDASLGNVPLSPVGTLADPGGFTVASENPVYIWGDYNTNSNDTAWNTPSVDMAGHSSSAVIADAVTFLSNSWLDLPSFGIGAALPAWSVTGGDGTVTNVGQNRVANSAWYRLAVAGGKNINFPQPTWNGVANDYGTDGGVHNFLRYLENWNGTLNYMGSIVSLYYSTYATGAFKCCNTVYNPPSRAYSFDLDFSNPQGLPPGTPMFRDVDSLGFREMLTTRTD
jgi:Tfp pilus assembly protein PilX